MHVLQDTLMRNTSHSYASWITLQIPAKIPATHGAQLSTIQTSSYLKKKQQKSSENHAPHAQGYY